LEPKKLNLISVWCGSDKFPEDKSWWPCEIIKTRDDGSTFARFADGDKPRLDLKKAKTRPFTQFHFEVGDLVDHFYKPSDKWVTVKMVKASTQGDDWWKIQLPNGQRLDVKWNVLCFREAEQVATPTKTAPTFWERASRLSPF
jgi:hypothetical protein